MDQPDALEDWVAIKEHPFLDESPKIRLNFNIAWNEIEQKIAITCRERSRVVSDKVAQGWTGLLTFRDIQGIHDQLCLIHPSLSSYLPALPLEPRGIWAYLSNPELPDDDICCQLEQYYLIALEICGQSLLTSTLFEEHTYDEYFENISALKRRNFDEAVNNAEDELANVLFLREGSINMLDMAEVYLQEDEALFHLNIALARLFNYQLQPFLDLRELAFSKVQEAKKFLNNPDLGARVKKQYADVFTEWQEQYVQALDTIQEIYKKYYTQTSELIEAVRSRMMEDKKKFGNSAFEISAYERLCRVEEDLSLEKQQKLKATLKWFENQRDKVKQEIASLDEKGDVMKEIHKLEKQVFDWQNKLYDEELKLMDEEEFLIKIYIQQILKQISESEDEITFHDAVEDVDELSSEEDDTRQDRHKTHPKLKQFKQRLTLINRKRANIRNRKKSYIRNTYEKESQKQEEIEKLQKHHNIQSKRDAQKKESSEKQEFINRERKKTLDRLRQHKQKYRNRNPLHPSRYQSKSGTRNSPDQPDGRHHADSQTKHTSTKNTPSTPPTPTNIPAPPPLAPLGLIPAVKPPAPPPPPPPAPSIAPLCLPSVSVKKPDVKETKTEPNDSINLSDIQSARMNLKKSSISAENNASKGEDSMSNMMLLIRQGVKLRRVKAAESGSSGTGSPTTTLSTPSESHIQHLQKALGRIQKLTASFSDDEDGDFSDQDFDD